MAADAPHTRRRPHPAPWHSCASSVRTTTEFSTISRNSWNAAARSSGDASAACISAREALIPAHGAGAKGFIRAMSVQIPIWQWAIAKLTGPDDPSFSIDTEGFIPHRATSLRNVSISERSLLTTSWRSSTVGSSSCMGAGSSRVT